MLIQADLALLNRAIPTLAPVLMPAAGLGASAVGYFDALNTFGAMAFLIGGHPLVRRALAFMAGAIVAGLGSVVVAVRARPTCPTGRAR